MSCRFKQGRTVIKQFSASNLNISIVTQESIYEGELCEIVIFGTGETAIQFYQYIVMNCPKIKVLYFIDSKKEESIKINETEYQVCSPKSVQNNSESWVVICTVFWDEVIEAWQAALSGSKIAILSNRFLHEINELSRLGNFKVSSEVELMNAASLIQRNCVTSRHVEIHKTIINLRRNGNEIDFFTNVINLRKEKEIKDKFSSFNESEYDLIIEGGTFDGAEVSKLLQLCSKQGKVHSFDLTDRFVRQKNMNLFSNKSWHFHQMALSQTRGRFKVNDAISAGSFFAFAPESPSDFSSSQNLDVEGVALDDFFRDVQGKRLLIKLDLEGAEQEVIAGAHELVNRNKVDWIVAIYHKNLDSIQIPRMLLDFKQDYRFKFHLGTATFIDFNLIAIT